ncbi:MAG TPA: hypothetical protein VFW73_05230, partial [Lacipirellulaceae bacterium]|nr:hypothetical protein [Lacipirellulaceae bacterium]
FVPPLLSLFFFDGIALAAEYGSSPGAADKRVWSKEVNGLQARIEFKRSEVFNGTPIIATYLHLRNASDVMNPLVIPWDSKLMRFRVTDAKGKEVQKFNGPFDGLALVGAIDLVLPIRSELSFDYSSHGAGIPAHQAGFMDLGPDANWVFQPKQSDCFLHASLDVPGSGRLPSGMTRRWHGQIDLPPVKIPIGKSKNKAP